MKKRNLFFVRLTVSTALLILLGGCSKNPAGPTSDQQAIREVLEKNPELFNELGLDDDGDQPPEYDNTGFWKPLDLIQPIRFGRRGHFELESVDVDFISDSTAVVTVLRSYNGRFLVLARDTSSADPAVAKLYSKDMKNEIVRKAIMVRVGNTGDALRDWRIQEVSMVEARSVPTTLAIEELKIVDEAAGFQLTVTSPLETFFRKYEGLPTFHSGDTVKVYVKVSNSQPYAAKPGETVLMRHGADHRMHRARRPFNDNGRYPDAVAGDGIYSGWWLAGPRLGLHHAFIDVIDNGTIFDDVAPYNAAAWGTPYRVE